MHGGGLAVGGGAGCVYRLSQMFRIMHAHSIVISGQRFIPMRRESRDVLPNILMIMNSGQWNHCQRSMVAG